MIIYVVDAEPADEQFFAAHLSPHDVHGVLRLEEVAEDADIVSIFINEKIAAPFLEAHPRLGLIATRSNSTDHIDLDACRRRGVLVSVVPDHGENTTAEHTFALMLALARRLREIMALPKSGRFSYEGTRGLELHGKTLGIIGMGRIGERVATLARAFGMQVIAHDIDPVPELARAAGFEYMALSDLLQRSEIISLHASLTPATYHILNGEALAQCRPGVLIINTARGALIDTLALRDALDSGHVGGAGLDVLQDERILRQSAANIIGAEIVKHLRSDAVAREARDAERVRELQELMLGDAIVARTNVIFTPHIAFNTIESMARLRQATIENMHGFVEGQPRNLKLP